jgi:hypothetical protein
MLRLSAPTFKAYADIHRGDCLTLSGVRLQTERPPHWDMVVLLREATRYYDYILWVDADALIVDFSRDARAELARGEELIRLVTHETAVWKGLREPMPNAGVLLLRGGEETASLLEAIWENDVDHVWLENGAILEAMGYKLEEYPSFSFVSETPFSHLFGDLGKEWNSTPYDPQPSPVIKHYIPFGPANKLQWMYEDLPWRLPNGRMYPLSIRIVAVRHHALQILKKSRRRGRRVARWSRHRGRRGGRRVARWSRRRGRRVAQWSRRRGRRVAHRLMSTRQERPRLWWRLARPLLRRS